MVTIEMRTTRRPRGQNQITGTAGEHFVAAELSRRGWAVGLTRNNAPGVDLFASRPGSGTIGIDVKTRTGAYRYAWGPFSGVRGCDFIVLVDLKDLGELPDYWIIPAREARRLLTKRPGQRYGQFRNKDVDDDYYDAWELLEVGA
jgi:hypothetical protein